MGGLPLGPGLGQVPSNSFHNQGFLSAAQNHSAYVNPLQSGTSAAPPLFVGFLTNDVSMNQIRNLFTSYTKAVNDSRDTTRTSALAPKQKSGTAKRAPGRFDVNEAIGEESEDEIETPELGKRDATVKRTRETKVSDAIGKSIDVAALQAQGTKLQPVVQPAISPLPLHKKSTDEAKPAPKPAAPSGLFAAAAPKPAESKPAEPETKAATTTPVIGSLFGNTATAAAVIKKDTPATSAPAIGSGLFSSIAPVEPAASANAAKDSKPAEAAPSITSGLFGDVKEPSKRKIGEELGDKPASKPTESTEDPLKRFMALKPVEPPAPEKQETPVTSGLFAKPEDSTKSATTFTKQGPESLFGSALNQVTDPQKDKTDLLNSSFFGKDSPIKPASGGVLSNPPKTAASSFFGGNPPSVTQPKANPFLSDASSHDPKAHLEQIVKRSSNSPDSMFGPKDSTATGGGLFSGGGVSGLFGKPASGEIGAGSGPAAPAAPSALFSSLTGGAQSSGGLFGSGNLSAPSSGGLFGGATAAPSSNLFNRPTGTGTSGLFGGGSGSTGLFGS